MKERKSKQELRSGEKDYESCRFLKYIGKAHLRFSINLAYILLFNSLKIG